MNNAELAKQYLAERSIYSAEENGAIHAFAEWLDARSPATTERDVVVPESILAHAYALPGQ